MAKARNMVTSGLYMGGHIKMSIFTIMKDNKPKQVYCLNIVLPDKDFFIINEKSIKNVAIIDKEGIQTDTGSSIARGAVGYLLLGGAGLVAGAGMGKQNSINTIEITWIDDQKSLLEVDGNILSQLNKICWNINNNIQTEIITKEEILAQIEENKKKSEIETKKAKGCLITTLKIIVIILAFIFPPLWCLVLGYVVYKLAKKHIKQNTYNNIYYSFLYIVSILLFLMGITSLFNKSIDEILYGIASIFMGVILLPPIRAKINAYFLPKFKNRNILYGIIKFFIVMLIFQTLAAPSMNKSDNNTSIKQPQAIEQVKTTQKVEQEIKKETPALKPKTSNMPVKSENVYYSVANTLENYYKNYFNSDNWYVNSVIPVDNTINVSMIVVDPTWQENIKKYSSSRQYMVNCACPNSYTDVWHKIHKSDVSVIIYDVYGKRIGGGVCTN